MIDLRKANGSTTQRSESVSGFGGTIDVERIIECPFSLALEDAADFLPMLQAQTVLVRLPYRQLGIPIDGALSHRVEAHVHRQPDRTEWGRAHDELDFTWLARSRWLPDLRGVLRIRIAGLNARIMLHAEYVPPFGRLGSYFDRSVGHRIARATAAALVDRFAVALQHRWTQESTRHPSGRSTLDP
jgi:hypothetical protein